MSRIGFRPLIPTRSCIPAEQAVGELYAEDAVLQRKRYVVERTLGWLKGFRRLRYRVDRTAASFHAFVYLAVLVLCVRRLMRPSRSRRPRSLTCPFGSKALVCRPRGSSNPGPCDRWWNRRSTLPGSPPPLGLTPGSSVTTVLSHGHPVAPGAHEALLRRGAEGDLAVLVGEAAAQQRVEPFPGTVEIEGVELPIDRRRRQKVVGDEWRVPVGVADQPDVVTLGCRDGRQLRPDRFGRRLEP